MDGRTDGGRTDERTDGLTDGRTDGRTDCETDGRMKEKVNGRNIEDLKQHTPNLLELHVMPKTYLASNSRKLIFLSVFSMSDVVGVMPKV